MELTALCELTPCGLGRGQHELSLLTPPAQTPGSTTSNASGHHHLLQLTFQTSLVHHTGTGPSASPNARLFDGHLFAFAWRQRVPKQLNELEIAIVPREPALVDDAVGVLKDGVGCTGALFGPQVGCQMVCQEARVDLLDNVAPQVVWKDRALTPIHDANLFVHMIHQHVSSVQIAVDDAQGPHQHHGPLNQQEEAGIDLALLHVNIQLPVGTQPHDGDPGVSNPRVGTSKVKGSDDVAAANLPTKARNVLATVG